MTSKLLDVNALAVLLVENHPGHEYVRDALEDGLTGTETLLVYDYLPLRAQWVLHSQWDIDRRAARNAVGSFLEQPHDLVSGGRETLLDAYDVSAERNCDVYDAFYVALARRTDADSLVTTDTDFAGLCVDEPFDYENPVPDDVLAEFHAVNG